MAAAGHAHVEIGLEVFWDQVDPQDYPEVFDCPVCGAVSDWQGCCSKPCYDAWNGPMEYDPMDDDRF